MPETLKKCLEELGAFESAEVLAWLDGNPDAIHEMIKVVEDSHAALMGGI